MEISIIVPVYNTEKYLQTCIDSILKQDYEDFELILVDDGSTDASGAICDRYAECDPRVKVFHKDNGGVSSARNLGIEQAHGTFVTFIDSDDYIGIGYLRTFAECKKADMVVSIKQTDMGRWGRGIFSTHDITYNHLTFFYGSYFGMICCKFYQRKIINESGLRFDETIRFMEDAVFNLSYAIHCKTYSIIEELPYHYEYRSDSMSHTFDKDYARNIRIKYVVQCEFLNKLMPENSIDILTELKLYNFMLSYSYNFYHFESTKLFNTIKELFSLYIDGDVKGLMESDNVRMFDNEVMRQLYEKNKSLIKRGMVKTLYIKSLYLRFVLWNKVHIKEFLQRK